MEVHRAYIRHSAAREQGHFSDLDGLMFPPVHSVAAIEHGSRWLSGA